MAFLGGLGAILLVLLGVLAAPNLVLSRKPEWREYLDRLNPYQGVLGAVAVGFGLLMAVRLLLHLGDLFAHPIVWLGALAVAALQLALGLLLGLNILKSLVKQPAAVEKMDRLVERLAPKQGTLGLVAVIAGICLLVLLALR